MKKVFVMVLFANVACISASMAKSGEKEWIAPTNAKELVNPLKGNAAATMEGKKLFTQICAVCHGDKGKGDGVG